MAVIYSSEDYRMDYVSWRSIESRTGISKSDVYKFILKELLDNAVDFIESESHSNNNNNITPAEIKAIIKLNNGTIANSKTISLILRNSNPDNNPIARGNNSKEMLKSIFKIGVYYSSKRNIFRITKGALGDALKEILCIPYALAEEDQQIKWTLPLIIRNANKEFKIHLLVDKFNDTIHTEVDEAHYDISGATEVEVTLPIIEKLTSTVSSLANYMRTYAMFVTHIRFTLINEDKEQASFIKLDATQKINTKWKNLSSAHWYKRHEFHKLLLGLSKENPSLET